MQFYHDLITEKSFQLLQVLRRQFKFTLIGGWAVFFYTQTLKSKDVDVVVDYDELSRLKEIYPVVKNERLKKYEIKQGEVDVDIYLPHYSDLGMPVERLAHFTVEREGFTLPAPEVLFLLKLYAYHARRGSVKGKKDELDIFSLAFLPEFDWQKYQQLVADFSLADCHRLFLELLKNAVRVPELKVNEQKMAKQRRRILAECRGCYKRNERGLGIIPPAKELGEFLLAGQGHENPGGQRSNNRRARFGSNHAKKKRGIC